LSRCYCQALQSIIEAEISHRLQFARLVIESPEGVGDDGEAHHGASGGVVAEDICYLVLSYVVRHLGWEEFVCDDLRYAAVINAADEALQERLVDDIEVDVVRLAIERRQEQWQAELQHAILPEAVGVVDLKGGLHPLHVLVDAEVELRVIVVVGNVAEEGVGFGEEDGAGILYLGSLHAYPDAHALAYLRRYVKADVEGGRGEPVAEIRDGLAAEVEREGASVGGVVRDGFDICIGRSLEHTILHPRSLQVMKDAAHHPERIAPCRVGREKRS